MFYVTVSKFNSQLVFLFTLVSNYISVFKIIIMQTVSWSERNIYGYFCYQFKVIFPVYPSLADEMIQNIVP